MQNLECYNIRTLAEKLEDAGYDWAVLNYRGISSALTTAKTFNPGDPADFEEMIT